MELEPLDTSHVVYEPKKEYPFAGEMFQIINGERVKVVRWGSELLPVTHPIISQIVGQLALDIYKGEE
jgi:hypothetical protein